MNNSYQEKLIEFLKYLDIKNESNDFKNFIIAFTHSSYVNEVKEKIESYERLEFLGDSILNKIVTNFIFKKYELLEPGDMTLLRSKIVNKIFLSKVSKELNLGKFIISGQGEQKSDFSKSVYEDVFESFVGAIYISCGFEESKKFVEKYICSAIENFNIENLKDSKTQLQEKIQLNNGKNIEYISKKIDLPENDFYFKTEVIFDGFVLGQGEGKSKKSSEQKAAKSALESMVE